MTLTLLPIPHQVALSAIVVDAETSQRLAGVTAAITSMPAALQASLAARALQYGARWDGLAERPDRTRSTYDGSLRFVDLPDGAYRVSFSAPPGAGRYGSLEVAFTVARDARGQIPRRVEVVRMPPTAARGLVNGKSSAGAAKVAPVPAARVRVRGNGAPAVSRADGRFYLPDVEVGTITLDITASNHEPATRTVMIASGVITDVGTVTLIATAQR
jgi:hypothetical protein